MRVRLLGVRPRLGLGGQWELSSTQLTKINSLHQDLAKGPAWENIRQVITLEDQLTTWIKGVVLEVVEAIEASAVCEVCNQELAITDGKLRCEQCGSQRLGRVSINGRIRIDDGTGVVDVVLADLAVQEAAFVDEQEVREVMLREGRTSVESFMDSDVIGREIHVFGTAEKEDGKVRFKFKAKKILSAVQL